LTAYARKMLAGLHTIGIASWGLLWVATSAV